jgi:hypothetical protein
MQKPIIFGRGVSSAGDVPILATTLITWEQSDDGDVLTQFGDQRGDLQDQPRPALVAAD